MLPSSRNQSAATTALTAGIGELFRVKRLREIPHWWILGRCGPPREGSGGHRRRREAREALKSGPGASRYPSGGAGWAQELIQDFLR